MRLERGTTLSLKRNAVVSFTKSVDSWLLVHIGLRYSVNTYEHVCAGNRTELEQSEDQTCVVRLPLKLYRRTDGVHNVMSEIVAKYRGWRNDKCVLLGRVGHGSLMYRLTTV
jgi:hypothetical protein